MRLQTTSTAKIPRFIIPPPKYGTCRDPALRLDVFVWRRRILTFARVPFQLGALIITPTLATIYGMLELLVLIGRALALACTRNGSLRRTSLTNWMAVP
jgi:hypothetical protein